RPGEAELGQACRHEGGQADPTLSCVRVMGTVEESSGRDLLVRSNSHLARAIDQSCCDERLLAELRRLLEVALSLGGSRERGRTLARACERISGADLDLRRVWRVRDGAVRLDLV